MLNRIRCWMYSLDGIWGFLMAIFIMVVMPAISFFIGIPVAEFLIPYSNPIPMQIAMMMFYGAFYLHLMHDFENWSWLWFTIPGWLMTALFFYNEL